MAKSLKVIRELKIYLKKKKKSMNQHESAMTQHSYARFAIIGS